MNHTNAKTCLSRGIGGLPNACCWGTLPVASTSRHRVQKSLESEVAFKFIDRIHRQNISIKTFIFVKIAPLIGCSRRLDRNVIIIWINETLFFQREVFRYLPCETPWEQEVDVNSSDLADPMIQAIKFWKMASSSVSKTTVWSGLLHSLQSQIVLFFFERCNYYPSLLRGKWNSEYGRKIMRKVYLKRLCPCPLVKIIWVKVMTICAVKLFFSTIGQTRKREIRPYDRLFMYQNIVIEEKF